MSQAPPPPSGAAPPPPNASGYPVAVDLQREPEIKRWLPLVAWLLAIPHIIVVYALGIVAFFAEIVAFFTILFTKKIPPGVANVMIMYHRYSWRVMSYVYFLRNDYPKFEFDGSNTDPADDPATLSIQQPEEYQRFMPLIKWLLAIPHFLVLIVLGIGVWFALIIGFFAVLFTKKWPEGLRNYVVGYMRWSNRVMAYVYLLVDEYPPFSLD